MRNQNSLITKLTALTMALLFLVATNVTRVQAATTQNPTPQQVEAVIEDAFAGLVAFDVPRVMNNFAADAVLEDPAELRRWSEHKPSLPTCNRSPRFSIK